MPRLGDPARRGSGLIGLAGVRADRQHGSRTVRAIPSGYWDRTWSCTLNGFAGTVEEGQWTWHDSLRYGRTGCSVIGGSSGSPVVDTSTGQVVGVNNTINENGQKCTLNNPCEVNSNGTITYRRGQGYGQETYWVTTCLNSSNAIDLTISGCLLPKP